MLFHLTLTKILSHHFNCVSSAVSVLCFAAQVDSASGLTVLAEERMQLEASAEGNYPGAMVETARCGNLVEVVNGFHVFLFPKWPLALVNK